jgi:hypothetical protein
MKKNKIIIPDRYPTLLDYHSNYVLSSEIQNFKFFKIIPNDPMVRYHHIDEHPDLYSFHMHKGNGKNQFMLWSFHVNGS